jgi:hypothetical protein
MLSSGSFGSGATGCELAAQVAIQAFRGAAIKWGANRRKQAKAQFRNAFMAVEFSIPLPHRREIRRAHVHFVHHVLVVHLFD